MQEFNYVYNSKKENSCFAVKMRKLFEKKGVVKRELAEYIEARTGESVTRQAIGQWCNGITCPSLKTVPIIADFFGVSCDFLLTDTDIETPDAEMAAVCRYTGLSQDAVLTLNESYSSRNYPRLSKAASKVIESGLFSDMVAELSALEQKSEECLKSFDFMLTESSEKREVIQKIADVLQLDYMAVKRHLSLLSVDFEKQNQSMVAQDGKLFSLTALSSDVSCNLHRYGVAQLCEKLSDLFDHRRDCLSYSREELMECLLLSEERLKELQNFGKVDE